MDYKTFWRETYTHCGNLTVASSVVAITRNKKPSSKKPNGFRYKGWFRLVVEHHRHDQHGHGFAVFESVYRR